MNIRPISSVQQCRDHMAARQYSLAASAARKIYATSIPGRERTEIGSIKDLAEKAEMVLGYQRNFIAAHCAAPDKVLHEEVMAPLGNRREAGYFGMEFERTMSPIFDRFKLSFQQRIAVLEQTFNMKLHGGGGIFRLEDHSSEETSMLSSFTFDIGPGIRDFGMSLLASIAAHESAEQSKIPGGITNLGSFTMFNTCSAMTLESFGKSWIKSTGPLSSLTEGKGTVTIGTCVKLDFGSK